MLDTNNILWCCPSCEELNKWEDERCKNCSFSFDKALAQIGRETEDYPGNIISRLSYERIYSPQVGYYFRRNTTPTTNQLLWWHYVTMLGRATSGKHMPMSVVMKKYKSLKEDGFSQGEILSILGG